MLIIKDWPGRSFWQSDTLENLIFSTRSSGDLFFDYIEIILGKRDYKYRELAMCYYLCLCAGFRGKFHSISHQETIEQIKAQLLDFYNNSIVETPSNFKATLTSINVTPSN